jgi:cytochrome c oxidase subunit 2
MNGSGYGFPLDLDRIPLVWGAEVAASPWFPMQGSTTAGDVDWLFNVILAISVFFFVGIIAAMTWFVYRYRRRPGHEVEHAAHHNTALEVTWTVIPLLLAIGIFYYGFVGYLDLTVRPSNTYEVKVTGQKWKWLFTYPNGHVDDNLHVPADVPTSLLMTSEDVIHSVYIPDFRVKADTVPGRYTKLWFQPTGPGEHDLFCAEYCGTSHSGMISKVVVHPAGEFDKWLADVAAAELNASPVEAGQRLYNTRGCAQCHSVDGKPGTGPTFKGVFGSTHPIVGGASVTVDENYVRESVLEPQAKVVAGFNPVMPTYQGRLSDKEIGAIIEYLKTLK